MLEKEESRVISFECVGIPARDPPTGWFGKTEFILLASASTDRCTEHNHSCEENWHCQKQGLEEQDVDFRTSFQIASSGKEKIKEPAQTPGSQLPGVLKFKDLNLVHILG